MAAPQHAQADSPPILTGPIELFGNRHIRDGVILRAIPLRTGQPFSYSLLEEGRRNLWRIPGVDFAEITVAWQPDDSTLGLRVFVTERSTLSGNIWLERGYEDDLSLGLRAADASFLGTGHTVGAELVVINNVRARVSWSNPWAFGDRTGLSVAASFRSYRYVYDDLGEDLRGARIERARVGVRVAKRFGKRSRVFAGTAAEWVEGDATGITTDPTGDTYSVLELGADWDRRDQVPFPHRGSNVHVTVRSVGPFQERFRLTEGVVDAAAYLPAMGRVVLATGSVLTLRDGRQVPAYRREHIGGGRTLRGWDYGSFHGRHSLTGGVEVRVPLNFTEREPLADVLLGIAFHAFADYGATWDRSDDLNGDAFHGGAGVGMMLLNRQIQGLRFDYGWRQGSSGRFDFEIGMKF